MTDLAGKDVIVTGGNVGIGRPTALELAKLGASVTIIGRNEKTCIEAAREIIEATENQKVSSFVQYTMIYPCSILYIDLIRFYVFALS